MSRIGQCRGNGEHVIEVFIYVKFHQISCQIPYGLVVRIRRSHRRGPGSIPGVGRTVFFHLFLDNFFFLTFIFLTFFWYKFQFLVIFFFLVHWHNILTFIHFLFISALYPEQWPAAFWYFYPHCWI